MAWRIKTPCQLQFLGPTQSGKSYLIRQLLDQQKRVFDRPFGHVVYSSPLASETDDDGAGEDRHSPYVESLKRICDRQNVSLNVANRVPTREEILEIWRADRNPLLLILDDLQCFDQADLTRRLSRLSNLESHHSEISFLYSLQNCFDHTGPLRNLVTLTRNSSGKFLMYQVCQNAKNIF